MVLLDTILFKVIVSEEEIILNIENISPRAQLFSAKIDGN